MRENSYKDIVPIPSQVTGISFEDMVNGRRRYNTANYETCHSRFDRESLLTYSSSLIKRLNKMGYLRLSASHIQTYN